MLEHFIRPEHARWDTGTHKEVILEDCYRLRGRRFSDSDLIIDIGANIGLFSGFALENGAGKVLAFEASPMNYKRLTENLKPYGTRVSVFNRAVWISGEPSLTLHIDESMPDGNTGGISVLPNTGSVTVQTVGLDGIIDHLKVRYLKVDCEGSEYPILYSSKKLDQIQEMMIEVHPVDHLMRPETNVRPGENTPEGLTTFLTHQGFNVTNTARAGMDRGWAYLHALR